MTIEIEMVVIMIMDTDSKKFHQEIQKNSPRNTKKFHQEIQKISPRNTKHFTKKFKKSLGNLKKITEKCPKNN